MPIAGVRGLAMVCHKLPRRTGDEFLVFPAIPIPDPRKRPWRLPEPSIDEDTTLAGSTRYAGSDDSCSRTAQTMHEQHLPPLYAPRIRAVVHHHGTTSHDTSDTGSLCSERLSHQAETLLPKLRQVKPVSSADVKTIANSIGQCGLYSVTERGLMPSIVGDVSRMLVPDDPSKAFIRHVKPKMFTNSARSMRSNIFGRSLPQLPLVRFAQPQLQPIGKQPDASEPHRVHVVTEKYGTDPNTNQRIGTQAHAVEVPSDVCGILRFVKNKRLRAALPPNPLELPDIPPELPNAHAPRPSVDMELIKLKQTEAEAEAGSESSLARRIKNIFSRKPLTDSGLPVLPGWVITVKLWELQRESPAYAHFYRVIHEKQIEIAAGWIIQSIIRSLVEYAVPYADLKCERIIDIAQRPCVYPLRIRDLLSCLENIEEVLELVLRPGQRFHTPNGRELAALAIQNAYKRFRKRKMHLQQLIYLRSTRIFQQYWERRKCRKALQAQIKQKYETKHKVGFKRLWAMVKRDRIQIFNFKRIVVQLCSWSSLQEDAQGNASDVDIGRWVPRVLGPLGASDSTTDTGGLYSALAMYDDNVDMIFVLPHLSENRLNYFKSTFETSAFPKSPIVSGRLKFVVPEIARFLPKGSSVAAALFFSTNALSQIKALCTEKTALICSDTLDEYVVRCCTMLNMPYFGTSMEAFETVIKDPVRERKFLRDCCIPTIKEYESSGKSLDEFLGAVSKGIVRCKNVPVWSLWPRKSFVPTGLDNSFMELPTALIRSTDVYVHPIKRGTHAATDFLASVAVSRVGSMVNVAQQHQQLQMLQQQLPRATGLGGRGDAPRRGDSDLTSVEVRIKPKILPAVQITELLPSMTTDEMLKLWRKHGGGVVRAYPNWEGDFRIIEVGMSVEWSLQWRLIVTCETRMLEGKTYGMIVPQQSCDAETLIKHLYNVAKVCSAREIFGAVTVEFWAWKDPKMKKPMVVATRLKPYFTAQLQRASVILLSTGCKTDSVAYGMSYSRNDLPLKLPHLTTSMFGDRKKAQQRFTAAIPPSPQRVALHFENLWHAIVGVLTRRGALAKLAKRGVCFDPWQCTGILFTKSNMANPAAIPHTCIGNTLEQVMELFLGGLVLIERHLEATDACYDSNFMVMARSILDELLDLRRQKTLNSEGEGEDDLADLVDLQLRRRPRKLRELTGWASSHQRSGGIYDDEDDEDGATSYGIQDSGPVDLQDFLAPHITLPFGERFQMPHERAVIETTVHQEDNAPKAPTISSGTTLLLLEGIPSVIAAEKDPTLLNPVLTPPAERRRRRSTISSRGSDGGEGAQAGGGENGAFMPAALLAEQQENKERIAALVHRLEEMLDDGSTDGIRADVNKLKWHRLMRAPQLQVETNTHMRLQAGGPAGRRASHLAAISPNAAFNFFGSQHNTIHAGQLVAGRGGRGGGAAGRGINRGREAD
ncbi:hypothetical protein HK105_203829 [Polyrhizophydium stewartii]|uniref:IQCH-like ATP-grasp domain-containing protein n=1 Tax=Polyrhizophydium stewartii TaxID=2732419 RepID=A0ABR4NB25_9FUNG